MRTRIQKWGNSLAVRIPRAFADEAQIEENSTVDITVRSGKVVVAPVQGVTLDALVERITDENRHEEVPTGPAVGNEVW